MLLWDPLNPLDNLFWGGAGGSDNRRFGNAGSG